MALPPRRLTDPAGFGRVAVLIGGWSAEREISLRSGHAVHQALKRAGVDATAVDAGRDLADVLARGRYDRAFIVLHGRGGEDGTVQGLLECLGLPYTGSGVLGSAIGMDKLRCKQLFLGAGLPTAEFRVLRGPADFDAAIEALGLPLFVKPAAEGSSIGISKVSRVAELAGAYEAAADCGCVVLAERWLPGGEYTVGLLGDLALPAIRVEAGGEFYDYEAKYFSDSTRYFCPAGLPEDTEAQIAALARRAFAAVGASGWGRVDLMLDEQGAPMLLEVNTVPGMTDHSLVPMAAARLGMDMPELACRILETSLEPVRRGS
ncbi:MAG: D-alanine--D-alanine ligase [Chromatiales bacterium]|nr:D-alanine--D-alanine ligase [Chromatiales bacterium]